MINDLYCNNRHNYNYYIISIGLKIDINNALEINRRNAEPSMLF